MSLNPGMMSSETDQWATPQEFYDALDAEFRFTLDTAADATNAKAPAFYTQEDDGLQQSWNGTVWCNPPYGRVIGDWVKRGREAAVSGEADAVVMLVPSRTDTRWWHDNVMAHAEEVRFVKGRLKFGGKGPAPFPSAVVIFRPQRNVEAA